MWASPNLELKHKGSEAKGPKRTEKQDSHEKEKEQRRERKSARKREQTRAKIDGCRARGVKVPCSSPSEEREERYQLVREARVLLEKKGRETRSLLALLCFVQIKKIS